MKKLFHIVTLFALPLLSIAQAEMKINADIRGRSCSGGLGICSVSMTSENKIINQEYKTKAFKVNETTMVLEFNKSMLSEAEQKSLLNTTLAKLNASQTLEFVQEEDLIIDIEALVFLGINPKYNTIKKGNYSLIIVNDAIKITFKLWEH